MNPLASFAFLIATVQNLVAAVTTRDNLHLRPALARQAVAARLRSGIIVLRAFLRRLIILMALELEWTLVDKREEVKRPHGRKSKSSTAMRMQGFTAPIASPWLTNHPIHFRTKVKTGYCGPVEINMAKFYAQLDYLAKIAANPVAKAKRLAFHLARTYDYNSKGMIIAPEGPWRVAGYWGTEVSASFDAMAAAILTKSKNRPPPLPPPRTHWPTITAL
jgi:hypothetical protein